MEPKDLNPLLRKVEVELAEANLELNRFMESEEDYDEEEFIAKCEYLMSTVNRLQNEFHSLLESL